MVDTVQKAVRSRIMASIKAKNTQPEIMLRKFLHAFGFRYRLHVRRLPGCPDIVMPKFRLAIFVHGCFWHQHAGCKFAPLPTSDTDRWKAKFAATALRDQEAIEQLISDGWRVFIIWECGLTKSRGAHSLDWLPAAILADDRSVVEWPTVHC